MLYLGMITTGDIKNIAESFQAIAIGLGALFSAATLSPVLLKQLEHNKRVTQFRKTYPVKELNKNFRIVNNPNRGRGHIYLLDDRTMTTHHIENPETMKDLFFDWGQVIDVTPEEYNKYKPEHNIDTKIE